MLPQRTSHGSGPDREPAEGNRPIPRRRHNLTLKGREHLAIEGVTNVESFDRNEILLETEQGVLLVRGEDLNIKELNIEGTVLVVTGFVHGLEYQAERRSKQSKGFLGRLLR